MDQAEVCPVSFQGEILKDASDIPYVDKVVAFVDILGFAAHVQATDQDSELHKRLHWALTHISSYRTISVMVNTKLGISVFSDCIAVTGEREDYHGVIWAVAWVHANLWGAGILTRGGISFGKVFHSNEILYGEGLLKAYHIEKSAAVYPRIVVDPALADCLPDRYKNVFLSMDSDGLFFVDPFALDGTVGDADALLADDWDPHEVYLDEVEKHIKRGISEAARVDHKSKWTWLGARHAIAKEEYKKTRQTRLSSLMKETMK